MGDRSKFYEETEVEKQKWVVQKMPIKGGTLLRSAMLVDMFRQQIKWIEIEGETES